MGFGPAVYPIRVTDEQTDNISSAVQRQSVRLDLCVSMYVSIRIHYSYEEEGETRAPHSPPGRPKNLRTPPRTGPEPEGIVLQMATSKSLNTARTLSIRSAASFVSFCPIRPSILSLTHSQATSMALRSSGPRPGFLTFLEPGEPESKGQGGNHNSGTMMLAHLPVSLVYLLVWLARTQAHQWLLRVCVSSYIHLSLPPDSPSSFSLTLSVYLV